MFNPLAIRLAETNHCKGIYNTQNTYNMRTPTTARVVLEHGKPTHNHKEVVLHTRLLAKLNRDGDEIEISPLAIKYKN
jgi:hypothetical protein